MLTDEQTPHARIVCPGNLTGECNGSGYVTKRYAARRLEESKFEYYEVKDNYPDLIPVKHPSPEIEALIFKELGF